jgi:hypothetical protein
MRQIEPFFDALFSALAGVLMSLIRRLAKFAVAVPPAWYWGTIIHESSDSLAVGIAAAVVLEIGGMLSAYYAVAYWGTVKGQLSAGLTVLYLFIGIGVMWAMESATDDEKLIITAVFIIAGMVYVLSAMSELENKELATIEDRREWEREQEEKDREHRRNLEARQQELQAQNALQARLAHEQAQAEIAIAAEKTKASIANAEARKAKAQAKADESERKQAKTLAKADDLSGNALKVFEALRQNPDATNVEIAESLTISPQRVGQIKKGLNGAINQ